MGVDAHRAVRRGRRALAGRELLFGIRPEDIALADATDTREGLVLPVELVEPIGPRAIVHLAGDIKVVTDKRAAVGGGSVKLLVPPEKRRFFDAKSGLAIAEAGHGQA